MNNKPSICFGLTFVCTASHQGIRQFAATTMQPKGPQTASDPRQMVAGQIQRSVVPSGKEQPLDRLGAMRRTSVEGVNTMLNQNPQSLSHHNQGQPVQRMPFPPQSPVPPRQEHVQQTVYPVQGHGMPKTVPVLPGQRVAPQPAPVGVAGNVQSPQSQLSRSPLPPPRPIQPPVAQPSQTPPPTGFVQRAPSHAEPSPHRSTAAYRLPAPPYTQQQNINTCIRPAPPAYNSRPAYHGSYPPLAPKPAPGTQLTQQSQARSQLPSSGTPARAGGYPVVPSSPLQRQNFQPQTPPPNMPPSPLPSSTLVSGPPFATSQHDLPGGFAGRNIRPKVAQDRQGNREPLTG